MNQLIGVLSFRSMARQEMSSGPLVKMDHVHCSKLADFGEIVQTFIRSVCSNYNISIMKSTIDTMALSQNL